jgi:hypothetical protein
VAFGEKCQIISEKRKKSGEAHYIKVLRAF